MVITKDISKLQEIAKQVRRDIVEMVYRANSGHPGGSLSATEILVALYFSHMKHDPKNPKWEDRDYFILSKGHVTPVYYSVLARSGYFDVEHLWTFRQLGSILQGHPHRLKTPGVESSSGSLGQGLSVANGIALALKLDKKPNRVYVLMGDGELQEGQIWEAVMSAAHYQLDNLMAIVDYNNLQIDGFVEDVMGIANLRQKWEAFNWHVIEVDGHDIKALLSAYQSAESMKKRPTVIIARTIKGKGVSYMENVADWHGKAPSKELYEQAMKELSN